MDLLICCAGGVAINLCWWYYRWYPLHKCNEYILAGQYARALELAITGIKRWPYSFHAFTCAASAAISLQENEQALEFCEKALAIEKMQPGPWQLRSLSRLFLCLPGAIEDANQAVRLHPLSEQLISRAIVLSALMKPNEALPDCDLAISKNPKSNLAYATRASIYLKINRTTEARNDLEKAFTLEDNKQTVYICHLLMVQSLYEASIGQFDLGISTVTQALELIDTSSNGYINRGWYYILKRQPKDALSDFDRAELYDKSPLNMSIVQSNRARAFTLLGDLPQAMKFANEGLELNVRGTTLCARAICFFLNEDYENALADLDKSIELEPHELEAYWYKAKIMRHREDEDQAIENERKTAGFEHLFQF